MTKDELNELREAWAWHVLASGQNGPIGYCWFDEVWREGQGLEAIAVQPCAGRIEGAHWIKRQTVERWLKGSALSLEEHDVVDRLGFSFEVVDLAKLAAWDPRNGVPACERHHRIFDSQRVPLPSGRIVVWRHQVPAHVEAFALDWGLEHELERKHPVIGEGI